MKTFTQIIALQVCLFYMGTLQKNTFQQSNIILKIEASEIENQNGYFFAEIQSIYTNESEESIKEIDSSFMINQNNIENNSWTIDIDISIIDTQEARNVYINTPQNLTTVKISHITKNTFNVITDENFTNIFKPIQESQLTLNPLADIEANFVGIKLELIKNEQQIDDFSSLYLQSKIDKNVEIPDALSGIVAVNVNQKLILCIVREKQENDEDDMI